MRYICLFRGVLFCSYSGQITLVPAGFCGVPHVGFLRQAVGSEAGRGGADMSKFQNMSSSDETGDPDDDDWDQQQVRALCPPSRPPLAP